MPAGNPLFQRRKRRVRTTIRLRGAGRLRLSVCRSGQHIYAQIIDDKAGRTVVSASSLDQDLQKQIKSGATKAAAAKVGGRVAEKALAAGIQEVVFDRGGYVYHGRVKELADGARAAGLKF
ncbi:MAG: 50S ribosomal protein L18 [Alphaproteobacteria bacterium]|nr:50S ribosomal protein L18 [Alphaproteobacteria bacterium]